MERLAEYHRRMKRWLKITLWVVGSGVVLVVAAGAGLYLFVKSQILDSGGPLRPAMAAYDVRHYGLDVAVDPTSRTLAGTLAMTVRVVDGIDRFECNLDDHLDVSGMAVDDLPVAAEHRRGLVSANLATPWTAGERHRVTIRYAGTPKRSLRPPWLDGAVWRQTPSGAPWLGMTCEVDGGDIWWPCKDHPSDEPDEGMDITLTVPTGLVGLSNGRPLGEHDNGDGTTTSRWRVGYPINPYLVTYNVGPYVPVEQVYHGVAGDLAVPIVFWALPEHRADAARMWRQAPRILEVLGRRFGEYPFLADKYWVADAPYLGMEHQTLVAYGDEFRDNDFGFDSILLHETAHEWWGNKISAGDWADFWLHEGFATYAETLYVEDTRGAAEALRYIARQRRGIRNREPLVQGKDLTAAEAYNGDIYYKGAWVLHTLRWLVGDDVFFRALREFSCDPRFAYHTVRTADFTGLVESLAGRDLDWFWRRYLFTAALPRWRMTRSEDGTRVELAWDDPGFTLPLPIRVDGADRRVEMPGGRAVLELAAHARVEVDPDGRVLAARDG